GACRAGPNAFLGVQPRLGQVPPRSRDSIIATDRPARRTGPVTPMPALPPPMITTSNFSALIGLSLRQQLRTARRSFAGDGGGDRFDDHPAHAELRVTIPDVVTPRDPGEVGPNRPDAVSSSLRQPQRDGPARRRALMGRNDLRGERAIADPRKRRSPRWRAGTRAVSRSVPLAEYFDALRWHISLEGKNRLCHRHGAL